MQIFKAHQQWRTRPDDEKFSSLAALYQACKGYAQESRERRVTYSDIRVSEDVFESGDLLMGTDGSSSRWKLGNWAFSQLCQRVAAPAGFLRDLSAATAARAINERIESRGMIKDAIAKVLIAASGKGLVRAFTGASYERVWNYEVAERLLGWEDEGWEPARPDIRVEMGDWPAMYASDHDCFIFLRHGQRYIEEPGTDKPLWKGVIVANSEVGQKALTMTQFYYREMCGNHIIWGAKSVSDVSLRHISGVRGHFQAFGVQIRKWLDESTSDMDLKIKTAKSAIIGNTKEEVLDYLFGSKKLTMSRKQMGEAYEAVNPDEDGNPNTVWGFAQGVTRYSQNRPFADERHALDRDAGRLLEWSVS